MSDRPYVSFAEVKEKVPIPDVLELLGILYLDALSGWTQSDPSMCYNPSPQLYESLWKASEVCRAKMSDTPPLLRQWRLLTMLSARRQGLSVKEMAEESVVSQKTIRRDLELFQEIGFPIEETVTNHGRKLWHIDANCSPPQMNFTFDEAIAFYLARRLLEPLAGTPFWRSAQDGFRKIRSSLRDSVIDYLERMADKFHHTRSGSGDYSHKEELIDQLMIGIEDNRAVFITYQSQRATEPVTYDVYPFGISVHFGSLYLIGHKPDDDELRTWKVDRIEDAEATEVQFQRPTDFDFSDFFAGSFGMYHGRDNIRVRVWFSQSVARYVQESRWHDSQQLSPRRDGSLTAEFELSSTDEIKSWVLSFGRHATVLEPKELRLEIAQELQTMLAQYETTTVDKLN